MVETLSTMLELGTLAPHFELPDYDGKIHSLDDYQDKPMLVVFVCHHCPFVIHVRETLVELLKSYQEKGVSVAAISSNDIEKYPADSPNGMKEDAERHGYTFPYLLDESQDVAKAYRAACTPDFFLFDADHLLVYRGQMDGSRPGNNVPVTGEDLTNAVDALLAGQDVSMEQRPSMGCNIKWKPGNEPDYFGC
ncbi:MAG: thioredoxin family protein [bacterium]